MRHLLQRRFSLLALGLLAAAVATGWFLSHSALAGRLIERKLEDRLGTTVDFDRASVGIAGVSIENFRLRERNAGADAAPFLTVGNVDMNVGAVGAIFDKSPLTIRLRDARVLLRFNRNGELLTRLPKNAGGGGFPTLKIESGTLTIRQEGRADSVFHGIDLTVNAADDRLNLAGTVQDQAWGQWTANGFIPMAANGRGQLTLQTTGPQLVTPELLRQVPFVNPNAWKYVELAGTTPAKLVLSLAADNKAIGYRIELQPTETTVEIPNLGMKFTGTSGRFVASENVIDLTDVRGRSAGGDIRVRSRLDFSKPDSVLRFHADLKRMDVQALPRSWRLPAQIDGRLSGALEFVVALPASGGTRLSAKGHATITEARLRGRPMPPIELEIVGRPGGALEFVQQSTAPDTSTTAVDNGGAAPASVVSTTVHFPPEPGKQNVKPAGEDFVHLNVKLRDMEISEAMKMAGVKMFNEDRRQGDAFAADRDPHESSRRFQEIPVDRHRLVAAAHR